MHMKGIDTGMKGKQKSLTASEVLDLVMTTEQTIKKLNLPYQVDEQVVLIYYAYDLMKDYIERLHPGTRTLI